MQWCTCPSLMPHMNGRLRTEIRPVAHTKACVQRLVHRLKPALLCSGTAAVMVLVSLAIALAAGPALLLLPQLPAAMSADERLALLRFLACLAQATGINIIALLGSLSEEELMACHTVHHEWSVFRPQMPLHGLHEVCCHDLTSTRVTQEWGTVLSAQLQGHCSSMRISIWHVAP